jgi:hypothetical protein
MWRLLAITLVAVLSGCASPGRWQVAAGPNGDILLNTATGETWSRYFETPKNDDSYQTSYWVKTGPRYATTQP